MRVLGVDYGDRNVGLALSDPLGFTAQPLDDVSSLTDRDPEDRAYFRELVRKHEIGRIVVGMPLRMDGRRARGSTRPGPSPRGWQAFAGVPVDFWDERLTTHQALGSSRSRRSGRRPRRPSVNQISAALILQGYLDSKRAHDLPPEDR